IREEDGQIAIGALTTHHDIEFSDLLRKKLPLLSIAAAQIGDPQVRNRGTIGGAASHADPFGDFPACLLALDAEFNLAGPRGERRRRYRPAPGSERLTGLPSTPGPGADPAGAGRGDGAPLGRKSSCLVAAALPTIRT